MATSNRERKRRRPYQRAHNPVPMREGENDRRIVQLVYHYRILSQNHLERLMGRSPSTVQRLLRRLYEHRYLERLFLPVTTLGSSPALYILDNKGIDCLHRMGFDTSISLPSKSLSGLFLQHALAINHVRIAIEQACHKLGYVIPTWLTDTELKADYDRVKIPSSKQPVSLIPDGYFQVYIPERGTSHFFLELDRGTMTTSRFTDKVHAYTGYYKSGAYSNRYGAKGFRVLTVVDGIGTGRVDNLLNATQAIPQVGKRFWFTHIDNLQPEIVLTDTVWQVSNEALPQALL